MYPITAVLLYYFPEWEPPENRKEWNLCLCPSHDDDHPSCSVNFDAGAVHCKACGFKGDTISIIRNREGLSFDEAVKLAERVSEGEYKPVPQKPARKSRRRVFGDQGANSVEHMEGRDEVPPWVRR